MKEKKNFKGTLLIIDDVPDNVKVLLKFLSNAGFKVLVAQNGKQGIKTAEYAHPDLILLDIMMPGVDGFEVCQFLKTQTNTQNIPIIFITALTDTVDKIKGFELGAADYITKPFRQEEVLARVTAHLNLYQLQQQLQARTIELQARTEELEKRNLELDAFAHTVAHDLKNPLNGIIVLTEVMIEDCFKEKISLLKCQEKLRVVALAGRQMFNIINAILMLAGVSRQTQMEIHSLDMSAILAQVLPNLTAVLKEYQYQGKIKMPEAWPPALGYAPWIQEVWTNYLTNGLKYGGRPPRLEVGATSQDDGMIRFWVRDNGPGLTPDAQALLFTPFTRLHKNRAEGHGLGLSIVQHIVEKLGGEVGVESIYGQGSLFYFTLPAA